MNTDHILQVSRDAVRKLMRHGWNVYPLEAFGFLLGTNEAGVHGAALHAPNIGRDGWKLSRSKRLPREVNQRRILKAWCARVGPIDYSNNYKTEYPRLYGILPHKKTRYPPPKKQEPKPHRKPSPAPSPHSPPSPMRNPPSDSMSTSLAPSASSFPSSTIVNDHGTVLYI